MGPEPFRRDDAYRFFGRDQETSDLYSLIVAHRTVLLYAQSGAGKTSLLNARLIPLLEMGGYDVIPALRISQLESGPSPAAARGLHIAAPSHPNVFVNSFAAALKRPRRIGPDAQPAPRILIFDQFEELFTSYPERWLERRGFFEELGLAMDADPLLHVLFAMREDFVAEIDPYEDLLPEEFHTRYRLERLRKDAALEAVEKPLEPTKIRFAPGAAGHLVDNLLKSPLASNPEKAGHQHEAAASQEFVEEEFVEPVQLQVVCFSLYRKLSEDTTEITDQDLAKFGNVDQALREFYQDALKESAEISGIEQDTIRRWFEEKVITEEGTRGLVFRGEAETGGIPNSAVDVLDELHVIHAEVRGRDRWYELSHDRFLQPVLRANDTWRARVQAEEIERRENEKRRLVRRSRVFALMLIVAVLAGLLAAWQWHSAAVQKRIADANAARADAAAREAKVNADRADDNAAKANENAAVADQAALAAQRAKKLAERRRNQAIIAWNKANDASREAAAQSVAANDAKADAEAQRNRAEDNALIAEDLQAQAVKQAQLSSSRALAATSLNRLAADPQLALLLAMRSLSQSLSAPPSGATKQAVPVSRQSLQALLAVVPSSMQRWRQDSQCSPADKAVAAPRAIAAVAFSADGSAISAISKSGAPFVWDVASGKQLLAGICGDIVPVAVALSPDGQLIATAQVNQTSTKNPLNQIIGKRSQVLVNKTQTASTPKVALSTHWYQPDALAFSSENRFLAIGGPWSRRTIFDLNDNHQMWGGFMARMRRIHSRILTYTMGKPPRPVSSITFAPDGKTVAFGAEDGFTELWDVESGKPIQFPHGHTEPVQALAFSPDSTLIATASRDATVRIEEIRSTKHTNLITTLVGHKDAVISVAFDPTGTRIATGSQDQTISIWDVHSGRRLIVLPAAGGYVTSVVFSADGKMLASGGSDGSVRIWDISALDDVMNLEARITSKMQAAHFFDEIGSLPNSDVLDLLRAAQRRASRDLSPEECREYLHRSDCPQLFSSAQ